MKNRWTKLKKYKRVWYTVAVLLIAALFIVVALLVRNDQMNPHFSGRVERLSVGVVGEYSSLSIIAKEKGYFTANGLDVDLKKYVAGPSAVADMLAGNVDTVTGADFVGVINSFDGQDLKILATQGHTDSFFLVVRTDHGIRSSADLKGMRIGITKKTAGEFYLGQYLTLHQIDIGDVSITNLPPDQLVDALSDGSLDAIITFNPHISEAQSRLGSKVRVWSLQGDQRLSVMVYGTGKLTSQRPEVVQRYLKALIQAEAFTQTNNEEARKLVGSYLKLDDAYMQRVWANISFGVSLDQDLLITMDDQARWAIENNLTTAKTVPDYLQLIYFDGLEAVRPESITVIR